MDSEVKAKEYPTEIDAERIFKDFQKAMETLQTLLRAEAERFKEDGFDCDRLSITIEPMEITVRVGNIVLWHRIEHGTLFI